MYTILRRRLWWARRLSLLTALVLAAPATTWAADPPSDATQRDTTEAATGADYDPWQRMNRGIFWFNDGLDSYALEPIAKGWDFVTPEPVQTSISNFFTNVRFPVVMINNVLQGKLGPAAIDVGRFMVNSTFGILGLFDPATIWGLPRHNEDFGQTLGWWGVPTSSCRCSAPRIPAIPPACRSITASASRRSS